MKTRTPETRAASADAWPNPEHVWIFPSATLGQPGRVHVAGLRADGLAP